MKKILFAFFFLILLLNFISAYGTGADGEVIFTSSTKSYGNLVENQTYEVSGNILYLVTNRIYNFTNFTLGVGMSLATFNTSGAVIYLQANDTMNISGFVNASFSAAKTPTRSNSTWTSYNGISTPGVDSGGSGGAGGSCDGLNGGSAGSQSNGYGGSGGTAAIQIPGGLGGSSGSTGGASPSGSSGASPAENFCTSASGSSNGGGVGGGACRATGATAITGGSGSSSHGGAGGSASACSSGNCIASGASGAGGIAGYSGLHFIVRSVDLYFTGTIISSGTTGGNGGQAGGGAGTGTFVCAGGSGGGGAGGGGSSGDINFSYSNSIIDTGTKTMSAGSGGSGGGGSSEVLGSGGSPVAGSSGSAGTSGTVGSNFTIDEAFPILTINTPLESQSILNISYNVSLTDPDPSYCTYWVIYGSSTVEVANTSISCSSEMTGSFLVATTGTYTYHFFSNDTAGNSATSSKIFTVSSSSSPIGGGGGGGFPSVGEVLKSADPFRFWNPDFYERLKQSFNKFFAGSEISNAPGNFYNLFVTFMKYIFRQPASLGGPI